MNETYEEGSTVSGPSMGVEEKIFLASIVAGLFFWILGLLFWLINQNEVSNTSVVWFGDSQVGLAFCLLATLVSAITGLSKSSRVEKMEVLIVLVVALAAAFSVGGAAIALLNSEIWGYALLIEIMLFVFNVIIMFFGTNFDG